MKYKAILSKKQLPLMFRPFLVSLEDIATQKIDFLGNPADRATIQQFLGAVVRSFKL